MMFRSLTISQIQCLQCERWSLCFAVGRFVPSSYKRPAKYVIKPIVKPLPAGLCDALKITLGVVYVIILAPQNGCTLKTPGNWLYGARMYVPALFRPNHTSTTSRLRRVITPLLPTLPYLDSLLLTTTTTTRETQPSRRPRTSILADDP